METKRLISVLAVMLIAFSSVPIIFGISDSGADSNMETKTLEELGNDTYWVRADLNGDKYELTYHSDRSPCNVSINHDASYGGEGTFIIDRGCNVIVEKDSSFSAGVIFIQNGSLKCDGEIVINGVKNGGVLLGEKSGSTFTLSLGGKLQIGKQTQTISIACGSENSEGSGIGIVFNNSVVATNNDCAVTAPKNGNYTLTVSDENNPFWNHIKYLMGAGKRSMLLDCSTNYIERIYGDDFKDCRVYFRNDTSLIFTAINTYYLDCLRPVSTGNVYVFSGVASDHAYKVDYNGQYTVGNQLRFAELGAKVTKKTGYVFCENGQTVDIMRSMGIEAMDGYRITKYNFMYDSSRTGCYTIDDPENFVCNSSGVIEVCTEQIVEEYDYTMWFVLLWVLLGLAIIAPFGARRLWHKE